MTDWLRPALVQRYGVDISKGLGILAMLGAPGAFCFLFSHKSHAGHVVAGAYALMLGGSVWTGVVGSQARRAEAQNPTAIAEPPTPEWWRPPIVQQRGVEISRLLAAAAILGFPVALCLGSEGRYRPYVLGFVYVLLLGGTFWTNAVGSEARRFAAQRAAAERAAAWAAHTAQMQGTGAPGEPTNEQVIAALPPPPSGADAMQGPAMVAVGCGGVGLAAGLVLLAGLVVIGYLCLLLLYGLGHQEPPSWLRW